MSEATYTHEVVSIWLPKHLNRDDRRQARVEQGGLNPRKRTTGNKGKLEGRSSLPQGKAHWLVISYQMVSPENIHKTCI